MSGSSCTVEEVDLDTEETNAEFEKPYIQPNDATNSITLHSQENLDFAPVVLHPGPELDRYLMRITPQLKPSKLNLMANPDFVTKASWLIAKLDHVRKERKEAVLFEYPAFVHVCNELINNLKYGENQSKWPVKKRRFDVNRWFKKHRGGDLAYDPTHPNTDLNSMHAHMFEQSLGIETEEERKEKNMEEFYSKLTGYAKETLDVDWLDVLFQEEMQTPGFVKALHHSLQMEEKTMEHMKERDSKIGGGMFI